MVAFPTLGTADSFQFAVDQTLIGKTNATRGLGGAESFGDGIYRVSPEGVASGKHEYLTYEVIYSPAYFQYFRASNRSGWDQYGFLRASIRPTERDRIDIFFRAAYINLNRTEVLTTEDGATDFFATQLGEVTQLNGNLNYSHSFSPRTKFSSIFNFQEYNYTQGQNTDNRNLGLTLQIQTQVQPRLLVGVSFLTNYRVFKDESGEAFRFQTTVNPNLILNYALSPRWAFSATAGPSAIFTEEAVPNGFTVSRFGAGLSDNQYLAYDGCQFYTGTERLFGIGACPVGVGAQNLPPDYLEQVSFVTFSPNSRPSSSTTDQFTYFMNASLRRKGMTTDFSLSYSRREDASQGNAALTVMDTASARFFGVWGEKWSWAVNAGWQRRVTNLTQPQYILLAQDSGIRSDADFAIAEAGELASQQVTLTQETSQVWAEGRLIRRLTTNASLNLRVRYLRWLKLELFTSSAPLYGDLMADLSFEYAFEPFFFLVV